MGLVLGQGRIVGGEGGRVIPRLAHHGQHPTVPDIQGHQGPAGGLGMAVQEAGQGRLRRGLEVPVQGQGHIPPRLGLHRVGLPGDPAVLVGLQHLLARGAVEIGLKGPLRPVLAHGFIHGVSPVLVDLPLLRAHLSHPAQNVGGQGAAAHPLDRRGEAHPCQPLLLHPGQQTGGNPGNGAGPLPGHILLLAESFQTADHLVLHVLRQNRRPGHLILGQNGSVAVQELAPGSGDGFHLGNAPLGFGIVGRAAGDLQTPEQDSKGREGSGKKSGGGGKAAVGHGGPPFQTKGALPACDPGGACHKTVFFRAGSPALPLPAGMPFEPGQEHSQGEAGRRQEELRPGNAQPREYRGPGQAVPQHQQDLQPR